MERRKNFEIRTNWVWNDQLREAFREVLVLSAWQEFETQRANLNNVRSGPI